MSEETPGNAGASTSTVPPGSGAAETNSGVAETPASSPGSTASPPAPSPDSSTGTGDASGGEAFDFGAMFAEAPPEIPPAAKEPVVPPAKEPAKVEPPVAAQPPQQQAKPEPTPAQPAATPAPAQPQPSLDTFDPEALSQHLAQNEEAAVQFTAENLFKMSPQEIEALETNVVEAVPRLLAKVLVKSQQNMLSQIARIVPAMIQRQTEMIRRNADNESKFYARWPDIKPDQHGDLVRKYAAVYRQMHPQATLEQIVEDLGPMVMMAARVVPQVGGAPVAGRVASPVSQPAPAAGRSPPPPPFVPAGAGATNSQRAPELNPIEVMFQDHG